MSISETQVGYSAKVRLQLAVGSDTYELWSIAPGSIYFREPCTLAPCDAEVIRYIDGRERRWRVNLPDGASPGSREARTVTLES